MNTGRILPSYTFPGSEVTIKAGDCVLIRPEKPWAEHYVAKVWDVISDHDGTSNVRVRISYYYRPEETKGGRRMSWNGDDEVYPSGHFDLLSVATIESPCRVHTLKEYGKLKSVGYNDFFHRPGALYDSCKGTLNIRSVERQCICKVLCDPDELTVQCDRCDDWFHPACFGISLKEAKALDHFFCGECTQR